MEIVKLEIDAVKLIRPRRHADARGYFVETWNRRAFAEAGIDQDFVQDNLSHSRFAGTIRGLHYQKPPAAQAKLIRVQRGAVFDVAVDLRRGAATFGRWISVVLTAAGGEQIFIPVGFAHGYCTLEPESEVAYKTSDFYSPKSDAGILWNDPDIAIAWPPSAGEPVLSEKDLKLPRLAEFKSPF